MLLRQCKAHKFAKRDFLPGQVAELGALAVTFSPLKAMDRRAESWSKLWHSQKDSLQEIRCLREWLHDGSREQEPLPPIDLQMVQRAILD